MIDWLWLRFRVADESRLPVGTILSVDPQGVVEWQTHKWLLHRGSHDGTMSVRVDARGELNISGSPAKFLQGHNLFGSNDIQAVAREVISRVLAQVAGIVKADCTQAILDEGLVTLLRVDINETYATGSRARCLDWIRAAADTTTMRYRGRGLLERETVYWGKRSRHFQVKAYCKGHEITKKGHQLPAALCTSEMIAYAEDALRVELQINARHLRTLNRDLLCNWKIGDPEAIYFEHLAKVNFSGNVRMTAEAIQSLPRELRKTYALWQAGEDVRSMLSRMTFYRHRVKLLEHGVDIASRRPKSNVVRLLTVIEARPKGIPDFAHGTPLYFDPLRRTG